MHNSNTIINSKNLKKLPSSDYTLVDVREPIEHDEHSIAAAKLIPLGQLEARMSEIDKAKLVVVMCKAGKRGTQALRKLQDNGFSHVLNLEGGIDAWISEGYAVERGDKKVFPLMQQVQICVGIGVLIGVILSQVIHPNFIYLSGFFGAGLLFAGLSGWCGLAMVLSKMPWNHASRNNSGLVTNCSLPNS